MLNFKNSSSKNRIWIDIALSCSMILCVLGCYALIMSWQWHHQLQSQVNSVGRSMLMQAADTATILWVNQDFLSLNLLLQKLSDQTLVTHSQITTDAQKIIAQTGSVVIASTSRFQSIFATPLFANADYLGELKIQLNVSNFESAWRWNLISVSILAIVLCVTTSSLILYRHLHSESVVEPIPHSGFSDHHIDWQSLENATDQDWIQT